MTQIVDITRGVQLVQSAPGDASKGFDIGPHPPVNLLSILLLLNQLAVYSMAWLHLSNSFADFAK